ncbi:hypothetical protein FB45DRAFT_266664 [Roridomyces roridus]|uniref:Uncharacterized protein n=1 Tax=Roridomyces roridus TaxID=1738132 RepID=A0AAD7B8M6_9AGAR|nr:hypothetical protein FB45DRAFT_266664 [Roridomyces roridus]
MSSHRNPSSPRSPVERRIPTSPATPSRHGGSSTAPAWMKDRIPSAELSPYIPFPDTLSTNFHAHPDCIIVPEQAQFLSVVPPNSPASPGHGGCSSRDRSSRMPHGINVVPEPQPVALLRAHSPPPPPAPGRRQDYVYGAPPGTPRPAPYPYAQSDPTLSRGIPGALGMQAFPTRADGLWRHGA